jgi:NAD(P)-dependent dehydrogenase (short-subunit alcohol dehydrogenase family)
MEINLADKVAIITGGSSGIGFSTALAFTGARCKVVIADILERESEETVRTIHEAGGEALFVQTDVSQSSQVERMVMTTLERFGRLDFAFNNAGIGGPALPTAEYTEPMWRKVLDVNLNGVWLCMKHEIPALLKSGGGAIVNMASILGQVGFANAPAYVTSKHGVIGLTKAAAIEYASQNIRVNAVCPGFIETPLIEEAGIRRGTEVYEHIRNMHAMKRLGSPDEVAGVVLFLCSEAAAFITGEAILIDGGYVAQ